MSEFEIGYLAGLVDGEGYIFASYSKPDNKTRPNLRIYCTSKSIIQGAARIMYANPIPRRDKGELVGWIAAVQGRKAINTLSSIVPHLTDPSKKCRALAILKVFDAETSIDGRHSSSEVFAHCPPPSRLRTSKEPKEYSIEPRSSTEDTSRPWNLGYLGHSRTRSRIIPAEMSDFHRGWLCGLVDGEGYIHIRYRSDRDTMYPRLRLFVKSRPIIEKVARLLGVNPYGRRIHGKLLGWYASVSHLKALRVLVLISPSLLDPSKKCRARKILDAFGEVGTIHSRLDSAEFFRDCPPPSRIRKFRRIINS